MEERQRECEILVLGRQGQLASELRDLGWDGVSITWLGSDELDLRRLDEVDWVLNTLKPRVIINTAAYTQVEKCEEDEGWAEAVKINVLAPQKLAAWCQKNHSYLIHFSTDYVFDGEKRLPYREEDQPNPLNRYGKSKREGEIAIINETHRFAIFRVSWLVSRYGNNFIRTILLQGLKKKSLQVVSDQYGSPTVASGVAHFVQRFVKESLRLTQKISTADNQLPFGIYHLSHDGVCSWYDLACWVIEEAAKTHPQWEGIEVQPINTDEAETIFQLKAKRPLYSKLDAQKAKSSIGWPSSDWKTLVGSLILHWADNLAKDDSMGGRGDRSKIKSQRMLT